MTVPAAIPTLLKRERLSDGAANAIRRQIVAGGFSAGARLPTEKELAAELGITRLTVREALLQLEAQGFTTTRHGSGTFVADVGATLTLAQLGTMLEVGRKLSKREALDLMEFREILLLGFVDAMRSHAKKGYTATLRAILEEARTVDDPARIAEVDYRFNETLARASESFFLLLLMRSLRTVHIDLGTIVYRTLGDNAMIIATQAAIVSALERGGRERLVRSLKTYLAGATDIIRRTQSE